MCLINSDISQPLPKYVRFFLHNTSLKHLSKLKKIF